MQVEGRINLNHSIWVAELKHLTFLCLVDSLGYVSSKFLIFRLFSLLLENLSYRHAMLNLSYFCFYRRVKQLWQQKKSRQVLGPQELMPLTRTWRQSRAVRQARWAVLSLWAHPWEAKHGGLKKPLTDLHWGLSRMFSLNAIRIYCCSPLVENKTMFGALVGWLTPHHSVERCFISIRWEVKTSFFSAKRPMFPNVFMSAVCPGPGYPTDKGHVSFFFSLFIPKYKAKWLI